MPEFNDDAERRDWLLNTLGETFCRKLGLFRIPETLTLSVVIPVYNERKTIHEILRRVRAVPVKKQIIVVDDCSTDGTRDILKEIEKRDGDLTVVYHVINQGKGAALRTGFREATGEIVIVQDADLEYDPEQYPQLIQPIVVDLRRRRLWLALYRRDAPRALLLAFACEQVSHAALQHVHES